MSEPTRPINFNELSTIDVTGHVETKNGFSYLSWVWAVDQMRRRVPDARWRVVVWVQGDGSHCPYCLCPDGSGMVMVEILHHDLVVPMQMAITDGANRPITPQSKARPSTEKQKASWEKNYLNSPVRQFNGHDVNTAIMRALAKGIATLTGIGLFLFAGEDIPPDLEMTEDQLAEKQEKFKTHVLGAFEEPDSVEDLRNLTRALMLDAKQLKLQDWLKTEAAKVAAAIEDENQEVPT